jgi:DNA-directed RNA polymerase subunit N (RpoN/RPB10)
MKVDCVSCGYEINLDHKVFDDYSGPIRCYRCGLMMEAKTEQGTMCYLMPSESNELGIAEEKRNAIAF